MSAWQVALLQLGRPLPPVALLLLVLRLMLLGQRLLLVQPAQGLGLPLPPPGATKDAMVPARPRPLTTRPPVLLQPLQLQAQALMKMKQPPQEPRS